jgi:hypothetical protein
MGTEDSSISMEFIDHHEPKIFEEGNPFRVVREDARVEHIGIRDDNIPFGSDGLPGILRCISIIRAGGDRLLKPSDHALEFNHLVLRKGFGRKEIKGL